MTEVTPSVKVRIGDVPQEEEATPQETQDLESHEVNGGHNTAADEITQALLNEMCSNDGSQSHTDMIIVIDPQLASDFRVPTEHVHHTRRKQIPGNLPHRTGGTRHSLSRTAGRQEQANQEPPPVPDQIQGTLRKRKRKRERREKSQRKPASGSITWPHVAPIDEKTACLDDVFQQWTPQAGEFVMDTDTMRYLADLYICFAGPHAFQQIRDGFSVLCCSEKIDYTTVGGHVRALDTIDNAHHFVRRAVHLGLYLDRQRETQIAKARGVSYPDRTALGNMTSCAFPDAVVESAEYYIKKIKKSTAGREQWSELVCGASTVLECSLVDPETRFREEVSPWLFCSAA